MGMSQAPDLDSDPDPYQPIYIYPYAHRLKRRVVNKLDLGKVNPIKSN